MKFNVDHHECGLVYSLKTKLLVVGYLSKMESGIVL